MLFHLCTWSPIICLRFGIGPPIFCSVSLQWSSRSLSILLGHYSLCRKLWNFWACLVCFFYISWCIQFVVLFSLSFWWHLLDLSCWWIVSSRRYLFCQVLRLIASVESLVVIDFLLYFLLSQLAVLLVVRISHASISVDLF